VLAFMFYINFVGTDVTEAPENRLPLNPVTFWAIIGTAAAVVLTLMLVILVVCCYCITYNTRKKRYVFQTGKHKLMKIRKVVYSGHNVINLYNIGQ
jgi:hypothetical protein